MVTFDSSTLFVSDLDGTLLNKNAEVSEHAVRSLNEWIGQGLSFTIATARTSASVLKILSDIRFNIPIILNSLFYVFRRMGTYRAPVS